MLTPKRIGSSKPLIALDETMAIAQSSATRHPASSLSMTFETPWSWDTSQEVVGAVRPPDEKGLRALFSLQKQGLSETEGQSQDGQPHTAQPQFLHHVGNALREIGQIISE